MEFAALKERLKGVPRQPGVYLYKDENGEVLYVGKAGALRQRMRSYFQAPEHLEPKVRALMSHVRDFDYIVCQNEMEALLLENNLIKAYYPRYNILMRDDKTYPWLKLTAEEFPRLLVVREKKDRNAHYFGPYTDVGALRETVRLLREIFPLRTCNSWQKQPRACLNYDLKRCLAPCQQKISREDYQALCDGLLELLQGRGAALIAAREREMQDAAAKLDFERAAVLRDQVGAMRVLQQQQQVSLPQAYNLDLLGLLGSAREYLAMVFRIREGRVVARDHFWLQRPLDEPEGEVMNFLLRRYYEDRQPAAEILLSVLPEEPALLAEWLSGLARRRVQLKQAQRGPKKALMDMLLDNAKILWEENMAQRNQSERALRQLAEALELEELPQRMECYDISHLGGQHTVASMVVFRQGRPSKKDYRRFKIRQEQNDDFASLAETLERRFTAAREGDPKFLPEPDLLLIDGGRGQLSAVKAVLERMKVDIPVFSLAKKEEAIFRPEQAEPIMLPRRHEGLRLLQSMRDEAHRFAIGYNRLRRGKALTASLLDDVPGIGPARRQALLQAFGSVEKMRAADVEALGAVKGMSRAAAEALFHALHAETL
ncbi:MAG: excinuclease ABC subunit UvrC [Syntrophomonadaceae bacterium]|nr:excinuclease ABC subunit UvrC [Syntrophomonadaceae bacterium]